MSVELTHAEYLQGFQALSVAGTPVYIISTGTLAPDFDTSNIPVNVFFDVRHHEVYENPNLSVVTCSLPEDEPRSIALPILPVITVPDVMTTQQGNPLIRPPQVPSYLPVPGFHLFARGGYNLVPSSQMTANITTVDLNMDWQWLETSQNVYDWSVLDVNLDTCVAQGKKISIGISAGQNSPAWLLALVQTLTFWEFNNATNPTNYHEIIEPIPWDTTYLSSYLSFVTALINHLKTKTAWDSITHFSLNGINRGSNEYRLPNQVNVTDGTDISTNATVLWSGAGYTGTKVLNTFITITNALYALIPDRAFSLPINGGFPELIDNINVRNITMDWIASNSPSRWVVKDTAIDENSSSLDAFLTYAVSNGIRVCGQAKESEYTDPLTPEIDFTTAVQNAIMTGMKFFEIQSEVLTQYPTTLNTYKNSFPAW